jgi:diadenosine tetraphosphate (Ap4A) HIT family hydrolase
MSSLRTEEGDRIYKEYRAAHPGEPCALCTAKPLKEFTHWKIVKNLFPYDRVALVHDMIIPKRHVAEKDITQEEWIEYNTLKHTVLFSDYEYIIEAALRNKSIPDHFHLHLIITKPHLEE